MYGYACALLTVLLPATAGGLVYRGAHLNRHRPACHAVYRNLLRHRQRQRGSRELARCVPAVWISEACLRADVLFIQNGSAIRS